MKRVFAVFGLFLFNAVSAMHGPWAQSPAADIFQHPLGPETLSAFTLTCSRLAEHPIIKGSFVQEKTLSRLKRSLKSSGSFIIAADLGMLWDTAEPFPSTLVLGKNYLIQSRPGGQKNILSAQGNETFIRLAEIISAVFSGNAQGLLNNFKLYYTSSVSAEDPGGAWKLGLSPLDSAIGSFAERIIMNGDTAVRFIEIYEQSGDTVKYALSNHSYPAELNANEKAFFSFP